ncbi:MAG: hypothetical protein KDA77_01675 [Planctomycetaceae bacterium]|nr:hypothetical protein [Planctomycetaceae bacterium]
MTVAASWRISFLFTFLCIIAAGCSNTPGDQPDLGTVTGTVTLDEKPLAGVMVVFSPESGRSSMGTTDDAGKYELVYVGDTRGAKIGMHKISITTAQTDSSEEEGGAGAAPFKETIPAKYNTKSTLTEEVKAGDNVFDFKLTSK